MRLAFVLGLGLLPAGMAAGFEPGSLGSDYRDTGYMQGCVVEGELPGCTIIAGASHFVIAAEGPTPPEVMERLRATPKHSWIAFRGDILEIYDSYAAFALGAFELSAEPDPYADVVAAMQGSWVAEADPLVGVTVDGLIWTGGYGGSENTRSVIALGEGCADGSGSGPTLQLFEIGSAESFSLCFAFADMTPERMELTLVGRGNTLLFRRP